MKGCRSLVRLSACALATFSDAGMAAETGCGLLPPEPIAIAGTRPVEVRDLVELRDTGWADNRIAGEPPMTVSPDGTRFAFHLRRADLEGDRYCHGIVVMNVAGRSRPILIDRGGEPVRGHYELAGMAEFPDGSWKVLTPRWSPDGRYVAYLRRDHGVTQVWRAAADGSGAAQLTRSPVDVLDFAWLSDREILFSSRPELVAARATIAAEEKQGHLYDGRFFPVGSDRPLVPDPLRTEYSVLALRRGSVRAAVEPETRPLLQRAAGLSSSEPVTAERNDRRRRAWTEKAGPGDFRVPFRLRVERDGRMIGCDHAACGDGVRGLWWLADDSLLVLRQEGANRSEVALYRWNPGREFELLLRTEDVLMGCQLAAGDQLLCLHEGATTPRRFIAVNPYTGALRPVLDLNPEYRGIALQPSVRIHWTNAFGIESYGDLVLPPDHRPGDRHPLVITQYRSRGLLRGGTGDEVPVQLLARAGMAVLSADMPLDFAPDARTFEEFYRRFTDEFAGRRNMVSSLEAGIGVLAQRGLVDPRQVGITGFSDGSSTATYALIHTDLFAAASLSHCCEGPASYEAIAGPGWRRLIRSIGFPAPGSPAFEPFWSKLALAWNADEMAVPLLLQLSSWEYRLALETHAALTAADRPVEMHVFDDEYHIKNGPRHRAAIYERNVDWFRYWLRRERDPDPAKADQYRRWDALPRSGGEPKLLRALSARGEAVHTFGGS